MEDKKLNEKAHDSAATVPDAIKRQTTRSRFSALIKQGTNKQLHAIYLASAILVALILSTFAGAAAVVYSRPFSADAASHTLVARDGAALATAGISKEIDLWSLPAAFSAGMDLASLDLLEWQAAQATTGFKIEGYMWYNSTDMDLYLEGGLTLSIVGGQDLILSETLSTRRVDALAPVSSAPGKRRLAMVSTGRLVARRDAVMDDLSRLVVHGSVRNKPEEDDEDIYISHPSGEGQQGGVEGALEKYRKLKELEEKCRDILRDMKQIKSVFNSCVNSLFGDCMEQMGGISTGGAQLGGGAPITQADGSGGSDEAVQRRLCTQGAQEDCYYNGDMDDGDPNKANIWGIGGFSDLQSQARNLGCDGVPTLP